MTKITNPAAAAAVAKAGAMLDDLTLADLKATPGSMFYEGDEADEADDKPASTFDRKPQPTDHEVFPDTVTDSSGDVFTDLNVNRPEQGPTYPALPAVDYEAANRRMNALHVAVDFLRTREKDPAKVVEAAATFAAFLRGDANG